MNTRLTPLFRALNAGDFKGALAEAVALSPILDRLDGLDGKVIVQPKTDNRQLPKTIAAFEGFQSEVFSSLEKGIGGVLPKSTGHRIAICVGHSRKGDGGAVSVGGVEEWRYNLFLANDLQEKLRDAGIDSFIVSTYEGGDYPQAMRWLARHVKAERATAAVELHFNSAAPSATGYEVLVHNAELDLRSNKLAKEILAGMGQAWPGGRNRGVKTADRGKAFVDGLHCPAVIFEPFFGSNRKDWQRWAGKQNELAGVLAGAIQRWIS